jgi:hypothetical protein
MLIVGEERKRMINNALDIKQGGGGVVEHKSAQQGADRYVPGVVEHNSAQ